MIVVNTKRMEKFDSDCIAEFLKDLILSPHWQEEVNTGPLNLEKYYNCKGDDNG